MQAKRQRADQAEPTGATPEALTEDELRAQDADVLPSREVMSTLIWAPGPASIVPDPVGDAIDPSGSDS